MSDQWGRVYPVGEITHIHQRRYGGKGVPIGESGDCWATAVACFAGLTERDRNELHRRIVLSDLACRRAGRPDDEPSEWWNVTQRFLRSRVGRVIGCAAPGAEIPPDGIWIASGPSPRGDWLHAILVHGDGTLAWDPHPSGDGVDGDLIDWTGWWEPPAEEAA